MKLYFGMYYFVNLFKTMVIYHFNLVYCFYLYDFFFEFTGFVVWYNLNIVCICIFNALYVPMICYIEFLIIEFNNCNIL